MPKQLKHPYAAIEHRVLDSAAYADLTFSARSLLFEMARQLTKTNNGHLHAARNYMLLRGFSVNTLSRAISELIAHGMIYRTRAGGYQKGAAQYAVTWRSINNRDGLFLNGFKSCAWRYWMPSEKKSRAPKVNTCKFKNSEWDSLTSTKNEPEGTPKNEHNELIPIHSSFSDHSHHGLNMTNIFRFPEPAGGRLPPLNENLG